MKRDNDTKTIAIYLYNDNFETIIELLESQHGKKFEMLLVTNTVRRHHDCSGHTHNAKVVSQVDFVAGKYEYDVLWIVDSEESSDFDNDLIIRIKTGLENGKEVIVTRKLSISERNRLHEIKNDHLFVKRSINVQQPIMYDIHVPVVAIAGMFPALNKLKVGVQLQKEMQDIGYAVSLLGDSGDLAVTGCSYIDDAFYDDNMNVRKKVRAFNYLLHEVEAINNPDAIIAIVPDDYHVRLNVDEDNYGENLYAISKACEIDYLIICTPYDYHSYCIDNSIDGYCDISSLCLKDIDAIKICAQKMLVEETEIEGKPQWINLDESMCQRWEDLRGLPIVVSGAMNNVAQDIVDKLSEYSEAVRW